MAGGGPVGAPRVPSLARNSQTQPAGNTHPGNTPSVKAQPVKTQPESDDDDEEEEEGDNEEEEEEDEWVPDAPISTSVLASISASAPASAPVPVSVSPPVPARAPVPAPVSVAPSLQKEMVAHWETMINPAPLSPTPRYHIYTLIRTLSHYTYLSYICTHTYPHSSYILSIHHTTFIPTFRNMICITITLPLIFPHHSFPHPGLPPPPGHHHYTLPRQHYIRFKRKLSHYCHTKNPHNTPHNTHRKTRRNHIHHRW